MEVVGNGTYGQVYKGRHTKTGQLAAIKGKFKLRHVICAANTSVLCVHQLPQFYNTLNELK